METQKCIWYHPSRASATCITVKKKKKIGHTCIIGVVFVSHPGVTGGLTLFLANLEQQS